MSTQLPQFSLEEVLARVALGTLRIDSNAEKVIYQAIARQVINMHQENKNMDNALKAYADTGYTDGTSGPNSSREVPITGPQGGVTPSDDKWVLDQERGSNGTNGPCEPPPSSYQGPTGPPTGFRKNAKGYWNVTKSLGASFCWHVYYGTLFER